MGPVIPQTCLPLYSRLDVVVQAEEVRGVVSVLEGYEALVLPCTVSSPQPRLILLITVPVQIASAGGKRL